MYKVAPSLDLVDPERMDKALCMLHRLVGPSKMLTSADSCEPYSRDESEARGRVPGCVVLARSVEDVENTLKCSRETQVPVTPRAAGTGRSGGAVPVQGGIVLCTMGMAQIKEICVRDRVAVVGPGVVLERLHDAVAAHGLFYPPDPNSLKSCAIGGNIAENAGGPRAFKYGVTRDYVLGLQVCLMGGETFRMGRRTVKGVAGYDMTALMVGSEGTLGVVTEATLRLIAKPQRVMTALALFCELGEASMAVQGLVGAGVVPRCIELMDRASLQAVRNQGVQVDESVGAMLLVEVDGDEFACERDLQKVGEACEAAGALDVLVADDGTRRDKLWEARRELSNAIRKMAKNKLSEDIVVPTGRITQLMERLSREAQRLGVQVLAYGHAGDGNVHVNVLWDEDEQFAQVQRMIERVFEVTLELGGTITGEHGVGVLKAPYLGMEQSETLIAQQRRIKDVFDPSGLLNPGKMFAAGGKRCA